MWISLLKMDMPCRFALFRISRDRSSTSKMNKKGEIGHPCHTPVLILNLLDILKYHRTINIFLKYVNDFDKNVHLNQYVSETEREIHVQRLYKNKTASESIASE
jgi:hypothetical protein